MTSPTDASTPLSERLAALKDRMGVGPEVKELDPRLAVGSTGRPPVPATATDASELAPRIASLEQLVRALAEVVTENADSYDAALASLRPAPGDPTPHLEALGHQLDLLSHAVVETAQGHPDPTPRLLAMAERLDDLSLAFIEGADAQQVALTTMTELRAAVDAHAAASSAAIAALHEHLDQAVLAAVEAILSSR